MRLSVKGKNLDVSEAVRTHAERKFAKLSKLVPELAEVEVELSEERNPSNPANQVAEATIWAKGETLRGREATKDMKASIDQLVDKLERQVTRYRTRGRDRRRRAARANAAVEAPPSADELEAEIVKTKQFALDAMTPEEAVLQLELVGHDFFVFRSGNSEAVNIVYRRRDGGYGLIEPQ